MRIINFIPLLRTHLMLSNFQILSKSRENFAILLFSLKAKILHSHAREPTRFVTRCINTLKPLRAQRYWMPEKHLFVISSKNITKIFPHSILCGRINIGVKVIKSSKFHNIRNISLRKFYMLSTKPLQHNAESPTFPKTTPNITSIKQKSHSQFPVFIIRIREFCLNLIFTSSPERAYHSKKVQKRTITSTIVGKSPILRKLLSCLNLYRINKFIHILSPFKTSAPTR